MHAEIHQTFTCLQFEAGVPVQDRKPGKPTPWLFYKTLKYRGSATNVHSDHFENKTLLIWILERIRRHPLNLFPPWRGRVWVHVLHYTPPATPMHSSPTLIIPSATRIPIYQIRYQVEENDWMPIDYSPNVANCRKAFSGENIGTSDSGLYRSILQHVQAMERPLFIQRWQLGIEMTSLVFSRNNSWINIGRYITCTGR